MNKPLFLASIILLVALTFGKLYMLTLLPIFLLILSITPTKNIFTKMKSPTLLKFLILGILTGLLTETLAIMNNLHLPAAEKALFNPDPVMNIIVSFGYYIPLIIAWFFVLKKYKFKTSQIFIISGIIGVFAEGVGAALLSFNILVWIYVFLVHGSIVALPFSILQDEFSKFKTKDKKTKYLIAIIPTIIAFIIGGLWMMLLGIA